MPKVFYVNWFRKDEDGGFMWPGYGENSRVLAWIFGRLTGEADAVETPIGMMPPSGERGIDATDLDVSPETMARLLEVDVDGWLAQLPQMRQYYAEFGDRLPAALRDQLAAFEERLRNA
jgi:phosphoenolpyruvate carboxykinase (GTP)